MSVAAADELRVGERAYEAVIGIECHVELRTATKMFCGCRNRFGAEPNTQICPTCLGLPGALPVPNRRAIELIVLAGRAFGCEIPAFSKFDRKNYFYPDMPKDYQISQYDLPLAQGGAVHYFLPDGAERCVRLTRIHLEEDTGKSLHAGSGDGRIAGSSHSLLDFNRAGVPLMECVSEPDLRSALEAVAYLEALKRTFVALDVSDVKMEEGSLRCDVNLSLRPRGAEGLGTKVEIKNLNSFASVRRAIEHEIARQQAELARGGEIVQETRGWDESAGTSHAMRGKEAAHDYRYFPDPDLPPLALDAAQLARLAPDPARLPHARIARYLGAWGLSPAHAHQIADTPGLGDYLEAAIAQSGAPQATANLALGELARLANESGTPVAGSRVTPEALAELVALLEAGTITSKIGKDLIARLWREGGSPRALVAAEGLAQIDDPAAIDALVERVLAANPAVAADFRAGKTKVLGFLVGAAMKESRGKANPALVEARLRELLARG
ncbi:MAG: Asp-tRNA(Asn)/Glu-tRNA(Gln) amidotransferase subunit GatB [Vulcanimicrobiaceae bacterium]